MKSLFIFLFILLAVTANAQFTDAQRAELPIKNLLAGKNVGFENGTSGWTASAGTLSKSLTGANFMGIGRATGTWDASASTQTLTGPAYTITNGTAGTNGVMRCKVMSQGTPTHTFGVWDGTNLTNTVTIPSALTSAQYVYTTFTFGAAATTVAWRFTANANEPLISIDDCGIYAADGLIFNNVSQAQFIGSAYFATTAACTFTRTNTALGAMSDSDCPGPTVDLNPGPGTIQTTDVDAPKVTVNSLPPGYYRACFASNYFIGTGTPLSAMAINDGTTTAGQVAIGGVSASTSGFRVCGFFNYTTAANRSFELFASSASSSVNIDLTASNQRLVFELDRFPTAPEQSFRPDIGPSSWSGIHNTTCSWARTNASYGDPAADATCTLTEVTNRNFGTVVTNSSAGNALPGIIFTPTRTGHYWVCANIYVSQSSTGVGSVNLSDGVTTISERSWDIQNGVRIPVSLCGKYNAATTAAKTLSLQFKSSTGNVTIDTNTSVPPIEWNIMALDFSMNAPMLVGGVTNSGTGALRIEAAELNCDSSSAVTRNMNGSSFISAIGNISSGVCIATITTGIFSGTPFCSLTGQVSNRNMDITALSSTSVSISGRLDDGTALTAFDAYLICIGPR